MKNEAQQELNKIPVGISSCLLGERVRYDGGHKADSYIINTLGKYFHFRQFCPEVELGLGIPRKPIRLIRTEADVIECVEVGNYRKNLTKDLLVCADRQTWHQQLCGYILKKDSPSCGMERVKVWQGDLPVRQGAEIEGAGIYAARLMEKIPYLPVEEEGRLEDLDLRGNFIQRVFALSRWQQFQGRGTSVASLVEFHARHELTLLSHHQDNCQSLGKLAVNTSEESLQENLQQYLLLFMQTLRITATRENHVNVLQHIQSCLKTTIGKEDKQKLDFAIENYRAEQHQLVVPLTLLNYFFRKHPHPTLADSWYMNPCPAELISQ